MDRTSELRRGGELQSRLCKENGSPTYSAIIDALVENILSSHIAVEILRADTRDVDGSALYLRFLGAVNRMAVADPSCPLRRFFPSLGGQIDVTSRVGSGSRFQVRLPRAAVDLPVVELNGERVLA